jgi:hypothetical protein
MDLRNSMIVRLICASGTLGLAAQPGSYQPGQIDFGRLATVPTGRVGKHISSISVGNLQRVNRQSRKLPATELDRPGG